MNKSRNIWVSRACVCILNQPDSLNFVYTARLNELQLKVLVLAHWTASGWRILTRMIQLKGIDVV